MNLPSRPVDAVPMRAGRRAVPSERSHPVSVPPRRLVHETRAARALSLPSTLPAVAELLDVVRSELLANSRRASDAELSLDADGLLVVSYPIDSTGGRR